MTPAATAPQENTSSITPAAIVADPAPIRQFRVHHLDAPGRAALRACLRQAGTATASDPIALMLVFDRPLGGVADADLAALAVEIEMATPPVFALIDTDLSGAAAELALAARARIARDEATLAFDAVRLALPPGAGASQRLSRLVGAEAALELLCSGLRIDAATAEILGAVDMVTNRRLGPVVRHLARADLPPARDRREGTRDPLTYQKAIAAARGRSQPPLGPPDLPEIARQAVVGQIIDGLESAVLLTVDAALDLEATLFEEASEGPVAPALVHLERAWPLSEASVAGTPPAPPTAPPTASDARVRLQRIGLTGGGSRGAVLAAAATLAGLNVTLSERSAPHLSLAETRTRRVLSPLLGEGDAGAERLDIQLGWQALRGASIVVETLPGHAAARAAVLTELAGDLDADTVLVSSSDQPDLDTLAEALPEALPEAAQARLVGMRVPGLRLPRMRLSTGAPGGPTGGPTGGTGVVEIIAGHHSGPDAIAAVKELARVMRLPWVMAGPVDGFLCERLLWALRIGADSCLDAGARPAEIDAALLRAGFAARPYRQIDMLGLGRAEADRARLEDATTGALPQTGIAAALRRLGWTGRMAGLGYYDYAGAVPRAHPDLDAVLESVREGRGRGPSTGRPSSPERIVIRCLLAVTVEAMRLLSARRATSARALDLAAVRGTGLPAHMGGPLHWAARRGLLRIKADLARLEAREGSFWTAPSLLDDLIKQGQLFDDLPEQALNLTRG